MARKAREKSSTGVYAIVLRGNGEIFKSDEMREAFYDTAKKYLKRGLIGVAFSDSRADMLVRESAAGLSMDMKPLITSFARTYNRENENDGKVFADRFRSVPVESRSDDRACRAYMKGGEIAPQYVIGAAPVTKPGREKSDKKETAKPAKKAAGKKPEPAAKTPEAKPKKKSNLPSWLL